MKGASIFCSIFFLFTFFYYNLEKYLTGPLFLLIYFSILISFLVIIVLWLVNLSKLFKSPRDNKTISVLIVYSIILAYCILSPYKLSSEIFESPVKLEACVNKTDEYATIKFRANKEFEIHIEAPFEDDLLYGTYYLSNDTFFLRYNTPNAGNYRYVGDTLFNNGKTIYSLDKTDTDGFALFNLDSCARNNPKLHWSTIVFD